MYLTENVSCITYRDPDRLETVVRPYTTRLVQCLNANDFLWEPVMHFDWYYHWYKAEEHGKQFMAQFPDYGLLP